MIDLTHALGIARQAAGAAASMVKLALSDATSPHIRIKSDARDFVTDVDEAAQRAIIGIIAAAYPSHRFLGEEEGANGLGEPNCPYVWIIDPIDGTTNFIHRKPGFGTIIALRCDGETLLGLIHRPLHGDTFHAVKGGGAFVDGKPVSLRATRNIDDAIVCTNLRQRATELPDGSLSVRIPACGSVDNYGSTAEAFAEILLGRNDGAAYDGPHAWDVAAGCLMVQEAGGLARWELKDASDPRGKARCAVGTTREVFGVMEGFVFGKPESPGKPEKPGSGN
jgi:myo-inositol-1(or 4)-monophosphatase